MYYIVYQIQYDLMEFIVTDINLFLKSKQINIEDIELFMPTEEYCYHKLDKESLLNLDCLVDSIKLARFLASSIKYNDRGLCENCLVGYIK